MLLENALRCGLSISEFWELTPKETLMQMEAVIWREKRQAKATITQAWLTAALGRVKRMPALAQLLAGRARKLSGKELERRRREFREMNKNVDLNAINRWKQRDG